MSWDGVLFSVAVGRDIEAFRACKYYLKCWLDIVVIFEANINQNIVK